MKMKNDKITYSGLYLDNKSRNVIRDITNQLNIPNKIPRNRLHTTIFYSKEPIDDYIPKGIVNHRTYFDKFSIFDTSDGRKVLVIELLAPSIIDRNRELVDKFNIKSDFDTYRPHITISFRYDGSIPDINKLDFDVKKIPLNFNEEFRKDFKSRN